MSLDLSPAAASVEPTIPVDRLLAALEGEAIESFRPLLPVGYAAVAEAYREAAGQLTARDLTEHYTSGQSLLHEQLVPWMREQLERLSGGAWQLDDYIGFAAGSDVDLMTHLVEAVAAREPVCLFPGDWYGFHVGCTHPDNLIWRASGGASLGCLCIPSVRNGHFTEAMLDFLTRCSACLLNLNLYPTLAESERHFVSRQLAPLLPRSVLSLSFSRGFGLTASQLGVVLIHRDHPWVRRFRKQWEWFSYFFNALAARTVLRLPLEDLAAVDQRRREWVRAWQEDHGLPAVTSGSYYVKSYTVSEPLPERLEPLAREGVVRLCFKPPQTAA